MQFIGLWGLNCPIVNIYDDIKEDQRMSTDTCKDVDDGQNSQCGGPESPQNRYRGELKGLLIGIAVAVIYLGIFMLISQIP
jgi:hypothetical protein